MIQQFCNWWVFMNGPRTQMLWTAALVLGLLGIALLARPGWFFLWLWAVAFALLVADVATDIYVMRRFDRHLREATQKSQSP